MLLVHHNHCNASIIFLDWITNVICHNKVARGVWSASDVYGLVSKKWLLPTPRKLQPLSRPFIRVMLITNPFHLYICNELMLHTCQGGTISFVLRHTCVVGSISKFPSIGIGHHYPSEDKFCSKITKPAKQLLISGIIFL